jgi:hypothetical protein
VLGFSISVGNWCCQSDNCNGANTIAQNKFLAAVLVAFAAIAFYAKI